MDAQADYSEIMHEGCMSPDGPPLKPARMESRDIDALVGIATSSPVRRQPGQTQAFPSSQQETRPQAISEGGTEREISSQQIDVELYLRGEEILATRGQKTDSFIRVTLVEENLTEHEIGRTELQEDTLNPEFKHPIQMRFRIDDAIHLIRVELCDPGEGEVSEVSGPRARVSSPWRVGGGARERARRRAACLLHACGEGSWGEGGREAARLRRGFLGNGSGKAS